MQSSKPDKAAQPIKAMIVDDEILAIRHLKNLIDWETSGFVVAAEAVTAMQALDLAEKVKPRLIFMDIRMPAMDGLEVSRRILSRDKRTRIVLLTSHRDFEYAKSALEIGVSGYLLKHETNAPLLLRELRKYKRELELEEQEDLSALRQNLRDVLERDQTDGRQLNELEARTAATGGSLLLFFVRTDVPYPVVEPARGLRPEPVRQAEPPQALQTAVGLEYIESVTIGAGVRVMLFAHASPSGEYGLRSDAYAAAAAVRDAAEQSGLSVSILISPPFRKIARMAEVYRQMEKQSAAFVLFGKGCIVHMQDLNLPEDAAGKDWDKLMRMFRRGDGPVTLDGFLEILDEAMAIVGKPERFHPELFKLVCQKLLRLLERVGEHRERHTRAELPDANNPDNGDWYSVAGIRQWFAREAKRAAASGADVYSRKVERALRYIHAHYAEDLTCEAIGEALQISGDYLRKVFRRETGRTVSDYLTWFRMEMAKEMLGSGQYKIYEISEAVGYRTSQYFSQVFKKWTGQTPQQFMEGARTR